MDNQWIISGDGWYTLWQFNIAISHYICGHLFIVSFQMNYKYCFSIVMLKYRRLGLFGLLSWLFWKWHEMNVYCGSKYSSSSLVFVDEKSLFLLFLYPRDSGKGLPLLCGVNVCLFPTSKPCYIDFWWFLSNHFCGVSAHDIARLLQPRAVAQET